MNQRCKVPRECAELAVLVGEYHTHAHRARELRADTLAKLLQTFDAYRRPERFGHFIAAAEMDARGRLGFESAPYPQAAYLREALSVVQAITAQPFLAQGVQGAALGVALQQARCAALQQLRDAAGLSAAETAPAASPA